MGPSSTKPIRAFIHSGNMRQHEAYEVPWYWRVETWVLLWEANPCFHSFRQHISAEAYEVPGAVLGAGDATVT